MKHYLRLIDKFLANKPISIAELPQALPTSRRIWVQNFVAVSGTCVVAWACGDDGKGNKAKAADGTDTKTSTATGDDPEAKNKDDDRMSVDDWKADLQLLNAAIALEHEALALYEAAAGLAVWGTDASPLAPTFLEVAKEFLTHHKAHLAKMTGVLNDKENDTGVKAVKAKPAADYLKAYPGIATLAGKSGLLAVLQVAAEREMNAANAYAGLVKKVRNMKLQGDLAGLGVDEAAHYGVLNAASFVLDAAGSKITQKNIVGGAFPPLSMPEGVEPRKAS